MWLRKELAAADLDGRPSPAQTFKRGRLAARTAVLTSQLCAVQEKR